MTNFSYDLAISAVPFDAALVTELFAELGPRLRTEPVWEGHFSLVDPAAARETLVADRSRLALVLHQRLWPQHETTRADETQLRARLREQPESVAVMTLDDTPVPQWLAKARRVDLRAAGVRGAADFALEAIERRGGSLKVPTPVEPATPRSFWPEGPPPFLSQPRAQPALRREIDALAAALKPILDRRRALSPEGSFEIHALPHRLIARLNDVAVSFSWVAGRGATVADGRLLVIAWNGVAQEIRGVAALKSASPTREQIYRPEGTGPDAWSWRMDDPNGRAYSTVNLVAEWIAGISIAKAD